MGLGAGMARQEAVRCLHWGRGASRPGTRPGGVRKSWPGGPRRFRHLYGQVIGRSTAKAVAGMMQSLLAGALTERSIQCCAETEEPRRYEGMFRVA